jgi:hypothetical protein
MAMVLNQGQKSYLRTLIHPAFIAIKFRLTLFMNNPDLSRSIICPLILNRLFLKSIALFRDSAPALEQGDACNNGVYFNKQK